MKLRKWESLPGYMQCSAVRRYYDLLSGKRFYFITKRLFDLIVSFILLVILSPLFLIVAIIIRLDSPGRVFYRQKRVTRYGRVFRIHKFRTMVSGADKMGSLVTVSNDSRVTAVGKFLRRYRIDEIPQLIDIFEGNMTFVGTRPETQYYTKFYTDEMKATLLMPAGVTSLASILYKDEEKLIAAAENADETYINEVLPQKMKYNIEALNNMSLLGDIKIMIKTVLAVLKSDGTDIS